MSVKPTVFTAKDQEYMMKAVGLHRDKPAEFHKIARRLEYNFCPVCDIRLVTLKQKPSHCTKCGKRRVIEFVCTFGMDDAEPRYHGIKKRELCKQCTNRKNACRHDACLANYREAHRIKI